MPVFLVLLPIFNFTHFLCFFCALRLERAPCFSQKVEVLVSIPKKLTEKERELMQELDTLQNESNGTKKPWFVGGN